MNDLNDNLDDLPVLTDFAAPESHAPSTDLVVTRLRVLEPDPGGYDPYNNAPPRPVDESVY